VDLEGSGEGLTKITSQIGSVVFPPVSGTVVITSSSEIRFLSIANTANSDYTLAVYASGVDKTARLTNVTLSATGTTGLNYGSYNDNASSTSIQNSTITTSGGASNRSIFNDNGSSPTILNSTITATGSNSNLGIYNNTTSFPIIQNSTITASGGSSNNYGLFNFFSSPTVQNSIITTSGSGLNFSIFNNGGITRVGVSQLGGAVSGTVLCVLSYSATYVALNPSCA
jgi:hypothetical protein